MPQVSIIIPAYNASSTITETIESVLSQTYTNTELIIINDSSTDDTLETVRRFEDPRVRVISIPNSGPSAARNKGIELAKGDYISFIDADDLWTLDKLELQLDVLKKHPEFDVVYSWTTYIDENGELLHPLKPVNFEGHIYEKLLINNFIGSGSNILVKKKALQSIGGFDPGLLYSEDWDLFIRLSKKCKFTLVKEFLVYYRQNILSMSSSIDELERGTLAVLDRAYKDAPAELLHLKSKSLSSLYAYSSYLYLTRQNDVKWKKKSLDRALKSILYRPLAIGNVKTVLVIFLILINYIIPSEYSKKLLKNVIMFYGRISTLKLK